MVIGIVAGCIIGVIVLCMLILFCVYRAAFYRRQGSPLEYAVNDQVAAVKDKLDAAIVDVLSLPYEEVSIKSFDGIILKAKYYHIGDNLPVAILMHGYGGVGERDFAGSIPMLRRLNHNILLVDQRAHGISQGRTVTFGIKEHRDCLGWIGYLNNRFGNPNILLMGVSMGGATVLMASALDLTDNVKCVVADCPYDTPKNVINCVIGSILKLNPKFLYALAKASAKVFGRFNLEENSPQKAISNAKVPILLIHGDEDNFVPCSMSKNLHNISLEKTQLHIIKGSGHALNQISAPVEYEEVLSQFIQRQGYMNR